MVKFRSNKSLEIVVIVLICSLCKIVQIRDASHVCRLCSMIPESGIHKQRSISAFARPLCRTKRTKHSKRATRVTDKSVPGCNQNSFSLYSKRHVTKPELAWLSFSFPSIPGICWHLVYYLLDGGITPDALLSLLLCAPFFLSHGVLRAFLVLSGCLGCAQMEG